MAYWLAVPFAGLGVTAIGKGFVSLFHHRHHRHYDERDLSDSLLPAIFHWNNTLLRGQDLERLDGLTLKNMAAMSERAMVSGQGFSVEGTVTEHNVSKHVAIILRFGWEMRGHDQTTQGRISNCVVLSLGLDRQNVAIIRRFDLEMRGHDQTTKVTSLVWSSFPFRSIGDTSPSSLVVVWRCAATRPNHTTLGVLLRAYIY